MLIFDDNARPLILDSIYVPMVTEHFWVLDLEMMDYTLAPLTILEEIVCPSVKVRVDGFEFFLPASWNMLAYDEETSQLDVVQLANAAGKSFTAVVYGPDCTMIKPGHVSVVDYSPAHVNVGPSLNKHQMLCHPVGPDLWISVSPTDSYNKYFKGTTTGDII